MRLVPDAEPGTLEGVASAPFRRLIAQQENALPGQPGAASRHEILLPAASVIQDQARLEVLAFPVPFLSDSQARFQLCLPLFKAQSFVDVERRDDSAFQQFADDLVAFAIGERNILHVAKLCNPGKRAVMIEASDQAASHQKAALQQQQRLGEIHALRRNIA